jgi:protein involved in plasmid replication-relaxation
MPSARLTMVTPGTQASFSTSDDPSTHRDSADSAGLASSASPRPASSPPPSRPEPPRRPRPAGRADRENADREKADAENSAFTPRDQRVLDLLVEHRVATTDQIARWAFPNRQRAQDRLKQLAERDGELARWRPYRRPGSAPYHYTVGLHGAIRTADRRNETTPRPSDVQEAIRRLRHSPNLAHLVGITEFFTRLHAVARATGGAALITWWAEDRAGHACDRIVWPDSYGAWLDRTHLVPRTVAFFYEHDRGTENLETVLGKLDRYDALIRRHKIRRPVLIELPTPARENNLHDALTARYGRRGHSTVYVATTNTQRWNSTDHGPAGHVWRPAGTTGPRRSLGDLPTLPDSAQVPS